MLRIFQQSLSKQDRWTEAETMADPSCIFVLLIWMFVWDLLAQNTNMSALKTKNEKLFKGMQALFIITASNLTHSVIIIDSRCLQRVLLTHWEWMRNSQAAPCQFNSVLKYARRMGTLAVGLTLKCYWSYHSLIIWRMSHSTTI